MPVLVFLILAGLPLAEIALFIEAGEALGVWPVIGLVALSAFAGVWLMRAQGPATLRRAQATIERGEAPVAEMLDGAALFVAAILMVTPGLLTSSIGLLLLIAPLRRLAARFAARRLAMRAEVHIRTAHMRRGPGGGPIIEAEEWEVEDEPRRDGRGQDGDWRLPPKSGPD
ncbi:MAG: FxsA family protein [Parvibaculum sp.]|uniref:FxsA family protein n=1 Tax=Parvibaculum sp. TaxID=2024848 RepID=UPI0032ED1D5E